MGNMNVDWCPGKTSSLESDKKKSPSWALGCSSWWLAWIHITTCLVDRPWAHRIGLHFTSGHGVTIAGEIHRQWPLANRMCPSIQGMQGMRVSAGKICCNWGGSWCENWIMVVERRFPWSRESQRLFVLHFSSLFCWRTKWVLWEWLRCGCEPL